MEFVPYSTRIRDLAGRQPDAVALVVETPDTTETYDFAAYDLKVDAFACALADGGVEPGTAVVIVSPNSSATVFATAASWRLGAFVVNITARTSPQDVAAYEAILRQDYESVVVVSDSVRPDSDVPVLPLDGLHHAVVDREVGDGNPIPARAIPSGGTTGRSKLILDPNPMGYSDGWNLLHPMGWPEVRSMLVYGPLYHNAGGGLLHASIAAGYTTVLMDRFDPARAQHLIDKHSIEFLFAVPTHLHRWLELPDLRPEAFDSVRSMYHSAAYCPPELKERWLRFMGPERVWEAFGATEGTGIAMIRGDEWLEHRGSVGRPMKSEFRILDDAQNPVPTGEVGVIYTRFEGVESDDASDVYMGVEGPTVTDDGFRTVGDMGWLDDEGYLYIADRRTDMIISGGANIFPAELEAVLHEHPAVSEAAVVGVPDQEWGRTAHAVIVPSEPRNPPRADELDEFMKDRVAAYKRPKRYEVRDHLPYTEVGKLDRRSLTDELEAAARSPHEAESRP